MNDDLPLPLHLLTPRSCRMARAGLGIKQRELARPAGVHVRTIKVFETDQARPKPKTAEGIMTALINCGVVFGIDGSIRIDSALGSRKRIGFNDLKQPARSVPDRCSDSRTSVF